MAVHLTRVIFLNGASCAGKTNLGQALQNLLDDPYLLLGLDTCFRTVPDRWAGGSPGEHEPGGFEYCMLPPDEGHPMLGIGYGEVGWRIMAGFHRGVAEIARAGNSVIVDEMLLDGRVRDHWFAVVAPFRPLLVAVLCGMEELERRERQRTNRLGLARWSAQRVHAGIDYDVTVDTTTASSLECAGQIVAQIQMRPS